MAVAAYLARFQGSSQKHAESDLRCYLAWCAERNMEPLAAPRLHPEVGYLLICPGTGAWQGSVWAPGSSLSIRLPTSVAWPSLGLRGPGAAGPPR